MDEFKMDKGKWTGQDYVDMTNKQHDVTPKDTQDEIIQGLLRIMNENDTLCAVALSSDLIDPKYGEKDDLEWAIEELRNDEFTIYAHNMIIDYLKDRERFRMEKCPFCGHKVHIMRFKSPVDRDGDTHLDTHLITGCLHCLAIDQHDVYNFHGSDDDLRSVMAASWNDQIDRLKGHGGWDFTGFPDDVTDGIPGKEKAVEAQAGYKLFLEEKRAYERGCGKPMPIWHGICTDYFCTQSPNYGDAELRAKERDERGLSYDEIEDILKEQLEHYEVLL